MSLASVKLKDSLELIKISVLGTYVKFDGSIRPEEQGDQFDASHHKTKASHINRHSRLI